jgi:phosphatidylserine decarboxylase
MIYRTRNGNEIQGNDGQDRFLSILYGALPGRIAVRLLVRPAVSKIGGAFLGSPLSRFLIRPFVKKHRIDLSLYEPAAYRSYNDFFTRNLKGGLRPFDREPSHLVSPCDAKLTVCPISKDGRLFIKQTAYTAKSLLRDKKLACRYYGGQALIFRLTVDDYHHYFYPDDGTKSPDRAIPGILHTVNPAANDVYPIYKENTRQYCLLKTSRFGTILMMEVGALMVGKIRNHHPETCHVSRGMEKGYFEFGGSTVILLLEAGAAVLDSDILANSRDGAETVVRAGEKIGQS